MRLERVDRIARRDLHAERALVREEAIRLREEKPQAERAADSRRRAPRRPAVSRSIRPDGRRRSRQIGSVLAFICRCRPSRRRRGRDGCRTLSFVPRQRPSRSSSPSATRVVQGMQPIERKPSATSGCSGQIVALAIGGDIVLRPVGERIDLDAVAVSFEQRQHGALAALVALAAGDPARRSPKARATAAPPCGWRSTCRARAATGRNRCRAS